MKVSNTVGLKFAALCRVSSEEQAEKGESLNVQKKMILTAVNQMGGTVAKWYSGQEHSTPGHEREILDAMLADGSANIFDALIITELNRLGRDMQKLPGVLEHLRKNNVRLFIKSEEQCLSDPYKVMVLNILGAVAEGHAIEGVQKSIYSKIERAKRGWRMVGSPPHGRRLANPNADKSKENAIWEVIPEAKERVQWLWHLYVEKGYGYWKIQKLTGTNKDQVRRLLLIASGNKYIQHINYREIQETIEYEIPPLLSDRKIQQVREVAKTHRQFKHSKNTYPLSSHVRCLVCGQKLSASTCNGGIRIYSHGTEGRMDDCIKTIRADDLEKAVFSLLGQILHSKEALEQSVKNVTVNYQGQLDELLNQSEILNKRKQKLETSKSNLIDAIAGGIVGKGEVRTKMAEIRHDLNIVDSEQTDLETKISNLSVNLPDDVMDRLKKIITALTGRAGRHPMTWPLKEKVKLTRFFFGFGRKDLGVFIKMEHDQKLGDYKYFEIIGTLGSASGAVSNYPYINDRYYEIKMGKLDLPALQDLIQTLEPDVLPTSPYKSPFKSMASSISRNRMRRS